MGAAPPPHPALGHGARALSPRHSSVGTSRPSRPPSHTSRHPDCQGQGALGRTPSASLATESCPATAPGLWAGWVLCQA